jgi:hypothetical protein
MFSTIVRFDARRSILIEHERVQNTLTFLQMGKWHRPARRGRSNVHDELLMRKRNGSEGKIKKVWISTGQPVTAPCQCRRTRGCREGAGCNPNPGN